VLSGVFTVADCVCDFRA